jgi:hypothetical protein
MSVTSGPAIMVSEPFLPIIHTFTWLDNITLTLFFTGSGIRLVKTKEKSSSGSFLMTDLILDPSFVEKICTYPHIIVFFVMPILRKILLISFFIAFFNLLLVEPSGNSAK